MRKILLDKSRSKKSVNNTNSIPINLNRDASLFHDEIISDTIDTMQVYNDDKDKSNKYRFIFTINPICTNAIFNKLTEVIVNEGSPNAYALFDGDTTFSINDTISKESIDRIQAIRNTEYSNPEYNFTYHCGADIFNNHLLRSKEDVIVQKRDKDEEEEGYNPILKKVCRSYKLYDEDDNFITKDGFNTIGDYARTFGGKTISTHQPDSNQFYSAPDSDDESILRSEKLPLYLYDEIKSFKTAYNESIMRKDGWIGFINRSTMQIPVAEKNGNKYFVNKCLNNKEACQFVDMCPERDLFYFTPKKNKIRKRIEYNWDYFLTYPSESIYNDNMILIGKNKGLPLSKFDDSSFYTKHIGSNGVGLLMFRSVVKHNLIAGDYVLLKDKDNNNIKCYVVNTGTSDRKEKEYYFSVYENDVIDYMDVETIKRFAKTSGGYECEYYFRKFAKFEDMPQSSINKLAFANTIYGDEVSQIVFTDSLDISEYKDNRGRPLTQIYLTILKNNRGYKEWYQENDVQSPNVEYSHVFGEVTSGLELPTYSEKEYPVIRRQHNINNGDEITFESNNKRYTVPKSSRKIESGINREMDSFYGDLVEFNPIDVNETILEDVYHRFNTAQRETNNPRYNTIIYDEVYSDIFDANFKKDNDDLSTLPQIKEHKINKGYANIDPEGYIYKPHHKIQIGMFSGIINQLSDMVMEIDSCNVNDDEITFVTNENYMLLPYDMICVIRKGGNASINFIVSDYRFDDATDTYTCKAIRQNKHDDISGITIDNSFIFKHSLDIPSYAYMLPDDTGRHLWRDLVKPSEYSYKDALYKTPFTNGSFYHHKNIMFFVRRQDPFKRYDMIIKDETNEQIENNFNIPSFEFDASIDEYVQETEYKSCL